MSKLNRKMKPPIPIEQWFRDMAAPAELREMLDSDIFKLAAATLKESAGPTFATLSSDPEANAMKQAWYAGYRDAFQDLEKLTQPKTTKNKLPQEWAHISLSNE